MKKYDFHKNIGIALLCTAIASTMILSGCGSDSDESSETSKNTSKASTESSVKASTEEKVESTVSVEQEDVDSSYTEGDSVKITLNGDSISVDGDGATADGSKVTITKAGTYIVSGKLSDGQILIEAGKNDTVKLILNGADITCSNGPAIYASKCEKTILVLEKDTTNNITDNGEYTSSDDDSEDADPNAAIFIQDDLTILGEGTLNVTANRHNGITTKDTLRITSGTINVTAAHHGITGKDNVYISDGDITVIAKDGDGIRSTYSDTDKEDKGHIYIEKAIINVTSANDGIQAEKNLVINSGTVTVVSGGGAPETISNNSQQGGGFGSDRNNTTTSSTDTESNKGIKAGNDITIGGGTITVDSYDDSVHSNGNVTITDGKLTLKSGDDGIHADETLDIKDGTITIEQSYEGLEGNNINISGGTVDLTASDDGINCSGGNDFSGLGGMDGGFGFGRRMPQDNQTNQTTAETTAVTTAQTTDNNSDDSSRGTLTISGGTVYVNAQGDGLDSNGDLYITGGTVVVNGTTQNGDGIIDHDGNCKISGGTLIGTGTSGMLEMPESSSEQNTVAVLLSQTQSAGTLVYITDNDGNILAAMEPVKNYSCIIYSSADLKSGETYKVYLGGTASGDSVNGYYSKAAVSGGTLYSTFTLTDTVTYADSNGNTTYSGGRMGGGMRNFGDDNAQMPDQNGDNTQMPQIPNQNGGNTQMPQIPDQNGGNTQMPQMPDRNSGNIQTPNTNSGTNGNAGSIKKNTSDSNSDNAAGQTPSANSGNGSTDSTQQPQSPDSTTGNSDKSTVQKHSANSGNGSTDSTQLPQKPDSTTGSMTRPKRNNTDTQDGSSDSSTTDSSSEKPSTDTSESTSKGRKAKIQVAANDAQV